jgi:uncharacterized cupredoxin-like copper-binding protein
MPKTLVLATTVLILAIAAAGCGGSSKSSSSPSSGATSSPGTTASSPSPSAGVLTDAADPSGQLKFTKTSLSAKAGKVTIRFTNDSSLPHNFTIQGTNGSVIGATPTFSGGSKTLTVTLKPGTYTFFCSVPGHRDAGMHGTLMVQ